MKITKQFLRDNEAKIQKHLDALAVDLGMGIADRGRISFDGDGFDMKVKIRVSSDPYAEYSKNYISKIEDWGCLPYSNWKTDWIGKTIHAAGNDYTFVGMANKRSKYCMVAIKNGTNKETGFTIDAFEKNFGIPVQDRYETIKH